MTTEHEIDSGASSAAQNNRIMREQKLHFILPRAGKGQWQVFETYHCIVHACQPEGRPSLLKAHTLVNQHCYPLGTKQVCN